jgi:hypothetical protein
MVLKKILRKLIRCLRMSMKQWLFLATATRETSMNKALIWRISTLAELTMADMVALEAWTPTTYSACSWALKWVEWAAIQVWAEGEAVAVAAVEELHQASPSNFNEN